MSISLSLDKQKIGTMSMYHTVPMSIEHAHEISK